ncbi:MAG: ABC transporter permease [Phycisphaerales bacterium]
MALTSLTIVRRSLTARRFSTAMTAASVAVAVAMLLVLLGMRDSARRAFARGSGNMHLLVTAEDSPLVSILNGVFYARAPARALTWTQRERIALDPRVAFAVPVQQGDSYRGFPVVGTLPEFFTAFSPDPGFDAGTAPPPRPAWPFAAGAPFTKAFDLVLGSQVWSATGLTVGDHIHLAHGRSGDDGSAAHVHDEFSFDVVGLLGPTGTPHDRAIFTHLDGAWIVHATEKREREEAEAGGAPEPGAPAEPGHEEEDAEHADEAGGEHHHEAALRVEDLTPDDKLITGIYVRGVTRDGSTVSASIPAVASELRRDPRLTVAEPAAEIDRLFRIVGQVDQVLLAMAAVVMVSSGVSILLALYNSMEQRRRQIAVLRVLGCSARRIAGIVIMEAVAIGLLGAAVGVAVSAGGTRVVAEVMHRRLGLVIESSVSPILLAGVVGGAILLAAVAGLIPAVMAYRTGVAKNLRPLG